MTPRKEKADDLRERIKKMIDALFKLLPFFRWIAKKTPRNAGEHLSMRGYVSIIPKIEERVEIVAY